MCVVCFLFFRFSRGGRGLGGWQVFEFVVIGAAAEKIEVVVVVEEEEEASVSIVRSSSIGYILVKSVAQGRRPYSPQKGK